MNFGKALEALKDGKFVARKGWNGKGMFIFLTSGSNVQFRNLKEHMKKVAARFPVGEQNPVHIVPHIDMKAADNSIVIGWLASQTDMFAEDWKIVD